MEGEGRAREDMARQQKGRVAGEREMRGRYGEGGVYRSKELGMGGTEGVYWSKGGMEGAGRAGEDMAWQQGGVLRAGGSGNVGKMR